MLDGFEEFPPDIYWIEEGPGACLEVEWWQDSPWIQESPWWQDLPYPFEPEWFEDKAA